VSGLTHGAAGTRRPVSWELLVHQEFRVSVHDVVRKITVTPTKRSSAAINSRLCSRAWDPGGLGPKLTNRFRSVKDLSASNSLSPERVGTLGLA